LQNQKHCFFNKQLSEEEYKSAIAEMNDIEAIKLKFNPHKLTFPHRENMNVRVENAVGNILTNCKNIWYGFDCDDTEDGAYIAGGETAKDVMDGDYIYYGERTLEQLSTSHANTSSFCYITNDSSNVLYSFYTVNSHNIFGCAFMKDKEYCILNKQYTKAEYEILVPQIIEHMKATGER